jgi:hypothetical protein
MLTVRRSQIGCGIAVNRIDCARKMYVVSAPALQNMEAPSKEEPCCYRRWASMTCEKVLM